MDLGLKGKVALVTAASSGLGKASALELAAEGAAVALNSRDDEALRSAAEEIRARTGADVLPVAGDVTSETDVLRVVGETSSHYGRIDIMITNAGGPPPGLFDDFAAADYRAAVELNLVSAVNLCREVVPLMRKNHWGRIVAIASLAAKQPIENLILSNTARAGLLGFMKSLSRQVAADGVTVNTLCPGFHLTDRLKKLGEIAAAREGISVDEVYGRWAASSPMRRIGQPEEFAAAVAFLCSTRAGFLTGTVIQVDGGVYGGLY
jgi:3-oxoacyl-[acyl-carrier protein] reductase